MSISNDLNPSTPHRSCQDKIAALEDKVEAQQAAITKLQQQLSSIASLLLNAANSIHSVTIEEEAAPAAVAVLSVEAPAPRAAPEAKPVEVTRPAVELVEQSTQYNYKNMLQEYCAKQRTEFASYTTAKSGGGFISTARLLDTVFSSANCKSKVLAEKCAAKVSDAEAQDAKDAKLNKYSWCKNQLQEYLAKKGAPYPTYNIKQTQGGYVAEVQHALFPQHVIGPIAPSKRAAQQMCAYRALVTWNIAQPEL